MARFLDGGCLVGLGSALGSPACSRFLGVVDFGLDGSSLSERITGDPRAGYKPALPGAVRPG
ncbi:hypothetical protein CCR95_19460 [Thiocystis minor]|nr:hypothetical protein [Thiocystis minor]